MKTPTTRRRPGARSVALVALGVTIGVASATTPAVAHVGGTITHLWSHLRPMTDARYANAVPGTDKARDADKLDGMNSASFWHAGNDGPGSGLDADTLDGMNSASFWHAGNDGPGSGLDADTLDGLDAGAFLPTSRQGAAKIVYGEMPPSGHITVGTLQADLALITITAPEDGLLLVTSQAAWSNNTANTYLTMELRESDGTLWDSWLWDPGDIDGFYDMHPTRTSLFQVTAGAHTYRLKAAMNTGTADVARTNLVAVFLPGAL